MPPLPPLFARAALVIAVGLGACAPANAPPSPGGLPGDGGSSTGAVAEEDHAKDGTRQGEGNPSPPKGEAAPPVATKPYDIVVSFRSEGRGIDRDARARLEAILDATPGLSRAHGRWGREGEVDECADLERLAPQDRTALVAKVRTAMKPASNVDVKEHHECTHDFGIAETRFELVVMFFSPGNGTDGKAEQALEQIASRWPKVHRGSYPWGKEGEHNECFDFGTDQGARDDFLHGIRMTVAGSARVRIYSDARCGVR